MTRCRSLLTLAVVAAGIIALPFLSLAQQGNGKGDLTHEHPAVANANVDFGVFVSAPIGPPPCFQVGQNIGGGNDPCSYKLHHLTPEEVTILKDGEVTFQIHGGGHSMAIYEVS